MSNSTGRHRHGWYRGAGRAALAAAAAVVAGCGGGNSPSAAAPATVVGAASAGATCNLPNFNASLLARVNQARAAGADCGSEGTFGPSAAVTWNDRLTLAATGHSQDMQVNNYFSHTSLDGRTLSQRVDATGYAWTMLGENIAAGQTTVDSVMADWMASPGHCANIMRPEFVEMGVACVGGTSANTYRTYWTMDFGRPR
jgi:uncharacterized protein YkwD